MSLDNYLKKEGISQKAFGAMLSPPVAQDHVSKWLQGQARITLDQALQIGLLTKGEVTPRDCANMYLLSMFSKEIDGG